jgi:L-ascorbate metabolism protein UlaG (beta-lactamase superfamily)
MTILPVLGKSPSGSRLERIRRSPHYANGSFQNPEPTEMLLKGVSYIKMMREYRDKPKTTIPPGPLPSVRTDLFSLPRDRPVIVWFGHSSYLVKLQGMHILVDPVFSGHASPFSWFGKAFPGTDIYGAEDFPDIDMMLLTHDHYDHLDYKTILQFAPKTRHFYTSLGVGAHLEYWGIAPERITELDWGESVEPGGEEAGEAETGIAGRGRMHSNKGGPEVGDAGTGHGIAGQASGAISLSAMPARHFSGRTFKRNQTLWSSFVLKGRGYSLFLGGDSGYGQHFKSIGDRHGPFDLAILESGQYGKNWPYIHMFPEQTATAAIDLGAKALLPVHWGKFVLSVHAWDEPIRRLVRAAGEKGLSLATPLIGEPVIIGEPYPRKDWWEEKA